MDPTSAELVERVRQGDEAAAESLFARYVGRLRQVVERHLHPRMRRRFDADDPVQSAYRSFFVRVRGGEYAIGASGDLWKLLVSLALNKLRDQVARHRASKRSVERERDVSTLDRIARGPTPLEAWIAADALAAFQATLPALSRRVLELRLQDATWPEIAAALGKSERTVRRTLEEVRARWIAAHPPDLDLSPATPAPIPPAAPAPREPPRAELDYRDFRLLRMVGAGGMGKVYEARDLRTGATVAIKMLRRSRWTSPDAVERFLAEATVLRRLTHPSIVRLRATGRVRGGGCFLEMDFVAGPNLAAREGPAAPDVVCRWLTDVADALAHAHANGVVHCDLKPSNLLLAPTGRALVSDFGLATSFAAGTPTVSWGGTFGYMAPEQLDPALGEVGAASDVFSLGVIAYELLFGRRLFDDRDALDTLAALGEAPEWFASTPLPIAVAQRLAACLRLDPRDRPSAGDVADDLRHSS